MNIEERLNLFLEKNCPTDPGKWAASKAAAKSKFDVYPSAYANGWASKNYKEKGGGWKKCETNENKEVNEGPCWDGYQQVGMKKKNGRMVPNCVPVKENINEMKLINLLPINKEAIDSYGISQPGGYFGDDADEKDVKESDAALRDNPELRDTDDEVEYGRVEPDEYDVDNMDDYEDFVKFMRTYVAELNENGCPCVFEAEYQGREVKLGKPMQGDVKKFKVYVKNPAGNVVKVNFGDPNMRIKKSNPERRKSFRARHNCDNPGPRHKARYWSCRKW